MVGRYEEAHQVLQRIHRDPKDPSSSIAEAEYTQIKAQVEFDKTEDVSYVKILRNPSWRKRVFLCMFLGFALQATGVNGISNYFISISGKSFLP
jgi:hypothetical protein